MCFSVAHQVDPFLKGIQRRTLIVLKHPGSPGPCPCFQEMAGNFSPEICS